jgi:hypothetical protein
MHLMSCKIAEFELISESLVIIVAEALLFILDSSGVQLVAVVAVYLFLYSVAFVYCAWLHCPRVKRSANKVHHQLNPCYLYAVIYTLSVRSNGLGVQTSWQGIRVHAPTIGTNR